MGFNMFDTLNEYRVAAERHYQKNGYTFDKDNLSKIVAVMNDAFTQYSRVFAFRVDLRFPDNVFTRILSEGSSRYHGAVLKAFFAELEKLFVLDQMRQATNGKRVRKTAIRYVWAREQTAEAVVPHYHLMFFLNGDAYYSLGNFKSENMNLANKLRVAWHRAVFETDVSIDFCRRRGLVQLSEKGQHEVFSNDPVAIKKVLLHTAYLAKNESKRRGQGYQCFGGSNL